MIKQKWQKNIIITLLFSTIIFISGNQELFITIVFILSQEGRLHIFADWAYIIKNTICNNLGFDIFKSHECMPTCWKKIMYIQ
jgi:hypothetical protein